MSNSKIEENAILDNTRLRVLKQPSNNGCLSSPTRSIKTKRIFAKIKQGIEVKDSHLL